MSIGSVNRVAMRKLSSSKIFDLHFYFVENMVKHPFGHRDFFDLSLTEINHQVEKWFDDLGMTYIWRRKKGFQRNLRISKKMTPQVMYVIKNGYYHTDKLIWVDLVISVSVNNNNLSMEDLDQVLKLGLEIERYVK